MNTIVRLMLVFMLMIVAAPAYAAEATQMWKCELDDDATEDQVMELAQKWLAAAKAMNGGENLVAHVHFPVAVNFPDDTDLIFVVQAPTFKEWGRFWDGYKDSPAAKLDHGDRDIIAAPDSGLWEAIKVNVK